MTDATRPTRALDGELALLHAAERQEGLITRADAKAAGLSADQIRHRVRSGRWERLAPGV